MSEQTPQAAADGTAPARPKKKDPKGVVLIGVLVGGLAAGLAAGVFAVGPMVAKRSGYVVTAVATGDVEGGEGEGAAGGEHGGGGGGGGEHAAKDGEAGGGSNLHLIDNLVLNPAGSGGTRFLMVAAAVELKDAAMVESFKARDAEVRDVLLRVIGAKTVEQLANMATRDSLRRELGDSLATLIPKATRKNAVRRVFFPQFVIQ